MTDRELLRAAIAASGLSVRHFARSVLRRDARIVWKWRAMPDTGKLPAAVRSECFNIVVAHWPKKKAGAQ